MHYRCANSAKKMMEKRADGGTRTRDLRITNALLYQLSHIGIPTTYFSIRCLKTDAKIKQTFQMTKLFPHFFRTLYASPFIELVSCPASAPS